jgi:chromosome segregation ATPase
MEQIHELKQKVEDETAQQSKLERETNELKANKARLEVMYTAARNHSLQLTSGSL